MEMKFHEKDIAASYLDSLITKDEVCSFITAHLYTKFVQGQDEIIEVGEDKLYACNEKLKGLLFDS